jgi:hypothetical protein
MTNGRLESFNRAACRLAISNSFGVAGLTKEETVTGPMAARVKSISFWIIDK